VRAGAAPLLATDAVRLMLAVGAVAVETSMVVQGSRPDAELAGLLVPLGLLAGAVTAPYLVVTVLALVALSRPGRGGVLPTIGLAIVDLVIAVVAVSSLGRAALLGSASRGPLLWGVLPLALGLVTLLLARRARRTGLALSPPDSTRSR